MLSHFLVEGSGILSGPYLGLSKDGRTFLGVPIDHGVGRIEEEEEGRGTVVEEAKQQNLYCQYWLREA